MQSGIYEFWNKQDSNDFVDSKMENGQTEDLLVELADMVIPMLVLSFGCLIALTVFMIEFIVMRWKLHFQNKEEAVSNKVHVHKKLKLDKWMRKYYYKRKFKIDKYFGKAQSSIPSRCHDDEFLKCRETVKGGYFIVSKFKKINKQKQFVKPKGYRFIQVQPCNPQED